MNSRQVDYGVFSKHVYYRVLSRHEELSKALPETRVFTPANLRRMFARYREVVLKPSGGMQAQGLILVRQRRNGVFVVQIDNRSWLLVGEEKLLAFLSSRMGKRRYMVQRRIRLATVGGRPFDIRVMVQRTGQTPWQVTAYLAKVAGRGYFVTNLARSKGYLLPLREAILRSSIRGASPGEIVREFCALSLKAVKVLRPYYSRYNHVGLDIGLDSGGRPWIIEVNYNPDLTLFLKLGDKAMSDRVYGIYDIDTSAGSDDYDNPPAQTDSPT